MEAKPAGAEALDPMAGSADRLASATVSSQVAPVDQAIEADEDARHQRVLASARRVMRKQRNVLAVLAK